VGRVDLKYLHTFVDRHGKPRAYYRRQGRRIAIEGIPGSPEFLAAYERVHASFTPTKTVAIEGTFGHLVERYYASHAFTRLRESTRIEYRRHIEPMRNIWSNFRLTGFTKRAVVAYRDSLEKTPTTANAAFSMLGRLFDFAIERGLIEANPTAKVKPLRIDTEGWLPWTKQQIEKFKRDAIGSSRVAFFLAYYTGQRRADVLSARWDSIRDGEIAVKQEKTGRELSIRIHPDLAAELTAERARQVESARLRASRKQPVGIGLTIVQRRNGLPYTDDGFGAVWTKEKKRVGGGAFHGLRKNATSNLFEAGCTPQEVQAITGHESLEMVAHYGKGADQKRLARAAMDKLEGAEQGRNADRTGKPSGK